MRTGDHKTIDGRTYAIGRTDPDRDVIRKIAKSMGARWAYLAKDGPTANEVTGVYAVLIPLDPRTGLPAETA